MNLGIGVAVAFVGLLVAPTTYGAPFDESKPLIIKKQGQKDRSQYCYTTLTVDGLGNWTAHTKFSNGKNIDGDHFQSTIIVRDSTGKDQLAVVQAAGVEGAFACKGSCERDVSNSGKSHLTSAELTEDASYECRQGPGDKDDMARSIKAAVTVICLVSGAPCTGV